MIRHSPGYKPEPIPEDEQCAGTGAASAGRIICPPNYGLCPECNGAAPFVDAAGPRVLAAHRPSNPRPYKDRPRPRRPR